MSTEQIPTDAAVTPYEQQQERGRMAQERADNSIPPPRLNRFQMMSATKRDNPDLQIGSALFREAFALNAMTQEGANLARLANFTGMSKGEVRRHITNIGLKIQAAQMRAASDEIDVQIEQKIRDYVPGEETDGSATTSEAASTDNAATADRPDANGVAGNGEPASVQPDVVPAAN